MDLIINELTRNGKLIFQGELTVSHVAQLHEDLIMALNGAEKIELDMQAVTEIDTSVLQLFCSAHKTAVKMQKSIELIDSSTELAKNTAGLNGFLRKQACIIDQTCLWKVKRTANE